MSFNRTKCSGCPIEGLYDPFEPSGAEDAPILVVVDKPSEAAMQNHEFLTKGAAKLWRRSMEGIGIQPEDMRYIPVCLCDYDASQYKNIIKKRVHAHCRAHFVDEATGHVPEVILPLGAEASSHALGRGVKITKIRGQIQQVDDLRSPVIPITSPAVVAKYPGNGPVFDSDIASLARAIDNGYDQTSITEAAIVGNYEIIDDLQFLIDQKPEILCYDIEATGLRYFQKGVNVRTYVESLHKGEEGFKPKFQILTMQFCIRPGEAYMLVWDHPEDPIPEANKTRLLRQLQQLLCNPDTTVVGANLKFDCICTWGALGIRFRVGGDTMMLQALHDENVPEKGLDALTKMYVPEMAGYADRFNASFDKSRMWEAPIPDMKAYGCGDVDAALRVYLHLESLVAQDEKLWKHYQYVSVPGLNAFVTLEYNGLPFNEGAPLQELTEALQERLLELRSNIYAQIHPEVMREAIETYKSGAKAGRAERAVEIGRTGFMRSFLFDHPKGLRLVPKVFTKSTDGLRTDLKEPSTSSKDHLPYFFEEYPVVEEIADYVKTKRLLETNVLSFVAKYVFDGKVRAIYGLHKAVTGRSNSCLRADVPVAVKGYGVKRADQVQVGDEVWTHRNRWKPVVKLCRKPAEMMYSVRLSNGECITATASHRFLLSTWQWAPLFFVKDELSHGSVSLRGKWETVQVESITEAGVHDVYDFEVEDDHSYLACGVLNHNTDPNGQNFPKRGKAAKAYGRMFRAPPGYLFIAPDLSQAELRIAAAMANDKALIKIYREGGDVHVTTAAFSLGISAAEFGNLSKKEKKAHRQKAKAVNFGFLFGMWWRKFMSYAKTQYGVDYTERQAKEAREAFFRLYKSLQKWHETTKEFVRQNGYVRSYTGRIRHLPGVNSDDESMRNAAEREGINSCVDLLTEMLTKEGWKTVDQLRVGEVVYSVNPNTLEVEEDVLQRVYRGQNDGQVWKLERSSISSLSTMDHRWLVRAKTTDNRYTHKILNSSHLSSHGGGGFAIPLCGGAMTVTGDGTWTDDEVALAGWAITDGHYKKGSLRTDGTGLRACNAISIAQSARANPDNVEELDSLLSRIGAHVTRRVATWSSCVYWTFSSGPAVKIRQELPDRTLTPAFLSKLSTAQLRILYDTMLKADGTYTNGRYTAFCAPTKEDADMFSLLCCLVGQSHTVSVRHPDGKGLTKSPVWVVHLNQRQYAQTAFGSEVCEFVGEVWCPTVRNGTFIARRNGKVYVTGNCVQETSSSQGVMALSHINDEIDHKYLIPCGFIHDALVFLVREEHVDWALRLTKSYMERGYLEEYFGVKLPLPLCADPSFGVTLGDQIEMPGFSLDEEYDYSSLLDDDGKPITIQLPPQVVPPNNGRTEHGPYTLPDDPLPSAEPPKRSRGSRAAEPTTPPPIPRIVRVSRTRQ